MKNLVLICGLLGSWMTYAACPVVISSFGDPVKRTTLTKMVNKALGKKGYYVASDENNTDGATLDIYYAGMMTTKGDYLVGVVLTLSDSHGMEEKAESYVDLGMLQFLRPVVGRIALKRSLRDLSDVLPYCSR